jgi:hypothetical protein
MISQYEKQKRWVQNFSYIYEINKCKINKNIRMKLDEKINFYIFLKKREWYRNFYVPIFTPTVIRVLWIWVRVGVGVLTCGALGRDLYLGSEGVIHGG